MTAIYCLAGLAYPVNGGRVDTAARDQLAGRAGWSAADVHEDTIRCQWAATK